MTTVQGAVEVASIYAKIGLNADEFIRVLKDAQNQLHKASKDTHTSLDKIAGIAMKLAGPLALGMAVKKLGDFATEATQLAARNEMLATSLRVVGGNAGWTSDQLSKAVAGVKAMGITTAVSTTSVTRYIQAQLGAGKSAEEASTEIANLARVAQDLAVVAGTNSSEALETLMAASSSLRPVLLRQFGITDGLVSIYDRYAKTLGKTGEELTETEQKAAFLARIQEEGVKVAGAYESAMGDVAKQMGSMQRYVEEAKVAVGEHFLPVMRESVGVQKEFWSILKDVAPLIGEALAPAIEIAAEALRSMAPTLREVVLLLTQGRDAVMAMRQETAEGAESYESYIAAMMESEGALALIQAGVSRLRLEEEMLRLGIAMTAEEWEGHRVAVVQNESELQRLSNMYQKLAPVATQGAQSILDAWRTNAPAIREAIGEAFSSDDFQESVNGLVDIARKHQDDMAGITGEGSQKQRVIRQQGYIEELKQQYNYIRESMKAALLKLSQEKGVAGGTAKAVLAILSAANLAKLGTEYGYVQESLKLTEQWAKGQIGSVQDVVDAFAALEAAQTGALAEAQANLDALMAGLGETVSAPSLPGGGGGIAEGPTPIEDVAARTVETWANAMDAMRSALAAISADFKMVEAEPFVEKIENMVWAMGVSVQKLIPRLAEIAEQFGTEGVDEAQKLAGAMSNIMGLLGFGKGIAEAGELKLVHGNIFVEQAEGLVWRIEVFAGFLIPKLKKLGRYFGEEVFKEAEKVSAALRNVLGVLSAAGDISKIGGFQQISEQEIIWVVEAAESLLTKFVAIANKIKDKIGERTAEVLGIMSTAGGGIKSMIDALLTLGGIEDYEQIFTDSGSKVSNIWETMKEDMQFLMDDLAAWDLKVNIENLAAVVEKLTSVRDIIGMMAGIVGDIRGMAEGGGLNVNAARVIFAQFSALFGELPGYGYSGPPSSAQGGGGAQSAQGAVGGGLPTLMIHLITDIDEQVYSVSLEQARQTAQHLYINAAHGLAVI